VKVIVQRDIEICTVQSNKFQNVLQKNAPFICLKAFTTMAGSISSYEEFTS